MNRTKCFANVSLLLNLAFSAYHIVLGSISHSWWLLTVGTYYVILSAVRFAVLRSRGNPMRITGVLLMLLSVPLGGTVILAFVKDRGTVFHLVVMLAIAVYAFTKITIATVNWIKARKSTSARLVTLRNISLADALVSIFSLQRSMLVSFEGMTETQIRIMNLATGCGVCILVCLLGVQLLCAKGYRNAGRRKKRPQASA